MTHVIDEDKAYQLAEKLMENGDVVDDLANYICLAWQADKSLMDDEIAQLDAPDEDEE